MSILTGWRKATREQKRSRELRDALLELDKPYTELYKDFDAFRSLTYEDLMLLFRNTPSVFVSSHEVADIFERTGYDFDYFTAQLGRLLRDKHVRREAKT